MTYKRITFTSGIRKISVFHHTKESARKFLATIEPDAWSDKTWNWRLEVGSQCDCRLCKGSES